MEQQKNVFIILGIVLLVLIATFIIVNNDSGTDTSEDELVQEEDVETTEQPVTTPPPPQTTRSSGQSSGSTQKLPPPADRLTVSYTSSGFIPNVLQINAGDTVTFVNNTNGTLWVTSKNHPTAPNQNYPEFDQKRSIGPKESWGFLFTRTGTWGYKNLNNEKHLGAIIVIPQHQQ